MHVLRTALLATAIATGTLVVAQAASATSAVSFITHPGHVNCGTVTSPGTGGCLVHHSGEQTLFFHIFGIESTEAMCKVEFVSRVGTDGSGYITGMRNSPGDLDCGTSTAEPCLPDDHAFVVNRWPWVGSVEKDFDNVVRAHYDICLELGESSSECEGEYVFAISETGLSEPSAERQTHTATDVRIGTASFCELTISASSETSFTHTAVHIKGN
jgi:hypothetical protein